MKENPCAFCNPELTVPDYLGKHGVDRIDLTTLYESERLLVKPDILPAGDFHALVIPHEHKFSFAQNHGLGEEVGSLLYQIEETIGDSLVWFEHGGVQEGAKVQSVYHNHAHLIGTEGKDVISYMESVLDSEGVLYSRVAGVDSSPALNLERMGLSDTGYFYVQQGSFGLLATDESDGFPSQITQRNMSKLLSGKELNWKLAGSDPELARQSIIRMFNVIEKCRK